MLLLLTFMEAQAQNNKVHFSVEVGGNWSQLQHSVQTVLVKYDKRLLYNAVAGIEFPFSEKYSFSANFRYVFWGENGKTTGATIPGTSTGTSRGITMRTDQKYLDLAFLFHYYIQNNSSGFYALFGPEAGYLLKANYLYNRNAMVGNLSINDGFNTDIKKYMYRWNLLLDAGIGYIFTGIKPQPYIQAIYSLGLIKTSKKSFSADQWSTRGLMFNVGVRF